MDVPNRGDDLTADSNDPPGFTAAHDGPAIPSLPVGVKLTTLENGLTIIVREDHSAPVVSAQSWCMAGSIHEGKWLGAGLSHVLEHMLFKGTTNRPGSRIDQEVQEAGGCMNAYTSFDRTVYHIDVPNTGARVALDILCDIMQNATLPADELAKEKQVILREMDMNIDDPARRASRRLFETAFTRSPYRFTIIGYPDIFHEVRPEDLLAFYREKYAANNVFYVVAGDIDEQQVVQQIQQAYAQAKARPMAPIVLPEEPRQTAPRDVVEEAPVELGYFHIAWHIPDVRHPDVPALDILATVLGHGRSSRLYQEVREKTGLVHSVDAWTYSPGNPGLFGVSATIDGAKFAAAREAVLAQIEAVREHPVSQAEMSKAIKQFVSATLAVRKTMQGQAQDLGASWMAANDLNFSERYLAAIRRAGPADVQRVARQYLAAENRTLYALLPKGSAPRPSSVAELTAEHPISKFELANGLRLLVKEDHRLPFVELRAVFRGGVLAETPPSNGTTLLLSKLLLKGTAQRSAEEIATAIESVGGSLDTYGGNNSFGLNAEVLSGDFALGLELVADVLLHPSFLPKALEREKQVQLAAIAAQNDQLLASAFRLMRRTLFGDTGYGLDALGTELSVPTLAVEQLLQFQQRLLKPNNCVLAIFGDLKTEEVRRTVEKAFAEWRPAARPIEPPAKSGAWPWGSMKRASGTRDKQQAVMVIGFSGVSLQDSERYPLELLQEACSDLGSRLFLRVREKLGLAYYVGAQNFVGLAPGYFAFYVGTAPENLAVVERELLEETELLRTKGLTPEEVHRAKAKIIGHKKIARQDLGGLALMAALDELYGLGYGHAEAEEGLYQAVTLEQVTETARKYLLPDRCALAVIRPP